MKTLFKAGALVLLFGAFAGAYDQENSALRNVTTDRNVSYHGNSWRPIYVPFRTDLAVLISSAPENAVTSNNVKLGISEWRFRQIVNCSNGGMLLMPSSTTVSMYLSSAGVVLGAGSASGNGDAWNFYGGGEVWAWFAPGTTSGAACGEEHYNK